MFTTDIFPPEIWVQILSLLEAIDIRKYQSVCKAFYHWAKTTPALQFLLELDEAGYVKARNYRKGISDEQQLSILREHVRRRRTLSPSRVDTLWKISTDHPHAMINMQIQGPLPVFAEGVLVRRIYKMLSVVQLPSLNYGTEMRAWVLEPKEVGFQYEFWIIPSLDLLVILNLVPYLETVGNGWQVPEYKGHYSFHLRTLSTNERHPLVCEPVLRLSGQDLCNQFVVKFIGRLMLLQLPSQSTTKLVIWDWMSGCMLLDEPLEPRSGLGFAILSRDPELIVFAHPNMEYNSSNLGLGSFGVYRLESGGDPSLSLVQVACFELPSTSGIPIHDTQTGSIFATCQVGLGFSESPYDATDNTFMESPPKLFETSNKERLLQLDVTLQLELEHPGDSEDDWGPESGKRPLPPCSSLCIPVRSILGKIPTALENASKSHIIPWSEWGSKTRWIHEGASRGDPLIAGSRCVFPHFKQPGSPEPRCVASVVEFHPLLQFIRTPNEVCEESGSASNPENGNSRVSILGSAPLEGGIDLCFDDESQAAELPYTLAELNHEVIAGERLVKRCPMILMSEEHMIVIQRTRSGHTKGVAVLTF